MSMIDIVESAKRAANGGLTMATEVAEVWATESPLIAAMPLKQIPGGGYTGIREGTLPSAGFRGVNGSWTKDHGRVDKFTESLAIVGGDMAVDPAIVKMHGPESRSTQALMKAKAIAHKVAATFIKGDQATSAEEFTGLQARCERFNRTEDAGATSGGNPLSLLAFDKFLKKVPGANALIMHEDMCTLLSASLRNSSVSGWISETRNSYGVQLMTYKGIPILEVSGVRLPEDYLGFDEPAPVGGQAQTTSIYAVRFGEGGVFGLENGSLEIRDLGESTGEHPMLIDRAEWLVGMADEDIFSMRRMRGITNAAVVA